MASKVANGNIGPSLFVKLDATANNDSKVLQCGAGDQIYGVSQTGSRRAPLSGWDDGYCAVAGENLRVYANPEDRVCWILVAGTVAPGDKIKSDANGNGVVTVTANDNIGGESEENCTTGLLCRIRLLPPGTKL